MLMNEAIEMDERLQRRATGLEDGVWDQRGPDAGGLPRYSCPWLVVSQGGKVIVECKSREEARREWKKWKGV